jgi:hypothetical protein
MTVDLSYAKKGGTPGAPAGGPRGTLALDTRGWSCGWAIVVEDKPQDCGMVSARDHVHGKPVPPSHKMAGLFRSLLVLGVRAEVDLVVTELKTKQGPIWMLPSLVAVALNARYGELKDWLGDLQLTEKSLRSWATVLLGKPPEDDLVASALGLAAVAARLRKRDAESMTRPGLHAEHPEEP